jgi:hypothetical protein
METFERETGLRPDEYWIEARPGGSPSWADSTQGSHLAHGGGARLMGWSAHGDVCLGFPGVDDATLRSRLLSVAARRAEEFPQAEHFALFALPGEVEVVRITRR